MMKANVVDLIRVSPEAAGVGTEPAETRRTVYCTIQSIGMKEAYQAMGIGLNPELKIVLAHDFEYQGEPYCEIGTQRYRVLRTYITETDGIELTLQRVDGNALPLPEAPASTVSTEEVITGAQ